MKNVSLALHGVLFVAVVVLYVLHFSASRLAPAPVDSNTADTLTAPEETAAPRVVYVNTDTLLEYYTFFKDNKEALEARGRDAERNIANRSRRLEQEFQEAQQKAQAGQLTREQAMTLEQDLMQKQQDLVAYRDRLTQEIVEEETRLNEELNRNISDFLRDFGRERNYAFVLGYTSAGGNVLFASDSLDVTPTVLAGLNATLSTDTTAAERP